MNNKINLLFITDDRNEAEVIKILLENNDYYVDYDILNDQTNLINIINEKNYDFIISDFSLNHLSGLEAFQICLRSKPDVPFIIIYENLNNYKEIDLIKIGIKDVINKFDLNRIIISIQNSLHEKKLKEEKQRIFDKMIDTEKKYISMAENINDFISILSADLKFIYFNNSYIRNLGYKQEELRIKKITDFIYTNDLNKFIENIEKSKNNKYYYLRFQYRIRKKNNKYIWLDSKFYFIYDKEYNLLEIQEFGRDITENVYHIKKLELINKIFDLFQNSININDIVSRINEFLKDSLVSNNVIFIFNYEYIDNIFHLKTYKHYDTNNLIDREICKECVCIKFIQDYIKEIKSRNIDSKSFLFTSGNFKEIIKSKNYSIPSDCFIVNNVDNIIIIPIIIDNDIFGTLVIDNLIEITGKDIELLNEVIKIINLGIYKIINFIKLKNSEIRYKTITNDVPALVCRFLPDGNITYVNKFYCDYFNRKEEELVGSKFLPLIPEEDRDYVMKELSSLNKDNPVVSYDHRVILDNGEIRWQNWIDRVLFDNEGNIIEYQSVGFDITERIQEEKLLKDSIKEKETLLKEIHHRVKNNMQIISSLLSLQEDYINEKNYYNILIDLQSRIKTMALVHEHLYQNKNISLIDLSLYLQSLAGYLYHTYKNESCSIEILLNVESIYVNIDYAIPVGLIANELISNSLKYAFKGRESGYIIIELSKDKDYIQLNISDNGIGIDNNIFKKKKNSLGLELVEMLVKQLNGEITVKSDNGSKFLIKFKYIEKK